MLQNKHTTLAENGENFISAQPRIIRASGGVQGKHSQSRKSIFKLGKEVMIHMISNVEGQSEDGQQGEPILVELSISVKTCCSQQAGAITERLLTA